MEVKLSEFNVWWRRSYLSDNQNTDLNKSEIDAKKSIDLHRAKVQTLAGCETELTKLALNGNLEERTKARTKINEAKIAVAALKDSLHEDPDIKKAALLTTETNSIIENQLVQMLQSAITNDNLDIEEGDRTPAAKYLLGRDKKNAQDWVAKVVEFQHKVTKEEWRSLLGLTEEAHTKNPPKKLYYYVQLQKIGNSGSHKTLYEDTIHEEDVVKTAADTLKDQVLGIGTSGFHITLEQQSNSHAYRKGNVLMTNYVQGEGDLAYNAAKTELTTRRDTYVSQAEAIVQKTKDEKGKKVKTRKVKAKLGIQ